MSDKGEVGASWGGYSASAGLGGILSGNGGAKGGLHAEAGTPGGHFAGAGLGGVVGGKLLKCIKVFFMENLFLFKLPFRGLKEFKENKVNN